MRWDFSVMGAKAYVLQLSENVRRSNEQKNKNGEITGQAPLGYENYIDERGKKFVRPKEPDATIIKQLFEMYSLGSTSVAELVHYANIMGLKSRKGAPVSINTIHYMLTNPFYYGEMRTFRGFMPHVYKPILTKELWDSCQEQKAIRAGNLAQYTDKPFVFKGMITCGLTHKICTCEIKKKKFIYVACWNKDRKRVYIREEELIKQVSGILNRIKLPNNVLIELQQELKVSKGAERKFYAQEIKKLREEQDKMKQKINNLFDLRLDGEIDRETFDLKRNELQVKLNRLKNKISAHEKADDSFDETILGLLDIATQAGNIFDRSQNLELKRLLLKFVFESLTLTEGVLSYKLKFPFNEFVNSNILMARASISIEPMQILINQGLQTNDNETIQIGALNLIEPEILQKRKGVAQKNATPLQIGDPNGIRTHITTVKG
ncbi:MAG: recombinase family protein [Alphaproteobacteria bacterium]|nr:recombinase family protein [Alphaproteobacteria bacterium]